MHDGYPEQGAKTAMATLGGEAGMIRVSNPTLRENIDNKIKWHKEEVERLEKIKDKMPFMLDVNLRDLREAMNF
jgi:hypothetical protein